MRRTPRLLAPALLLAALGAGPPACDPCLAPGAECTLADTADAVGMYAGAAIPPIGDPRLDVVPVHFNSVTAENVMKWGALARTVGDYDFTRADALVDWAEERGLRVRGHTLVWGKFPGSGHPSDLAERAEQADDPYGFMRKAIRTHVTTVVSRYAGRVETWDVVNEPLGLVGPRLERNVFWRAMGPDYIAEAFRAARAADPDAQLVLNEALVGYDDRKSRALLGLLDALLADGVPVDGVGIQGHLYAPPGALDALEPYLEAIAARGLTVELTEVDLPKVALLPRLLLGQELFAAQARVYGVFADACVAVPACRGMTVWGIDDDHSWLDRQAPFDALAPNEPLLLDGELQPKPAYHAVRRSLARRGA